MEQTREVMEVDVLFVGGGIAALSGALHLADIIAKHNDEVEAQGRGKRLDDVVIAILEKGVDIGAHSLSGAVLNPAALTELIPDFLERGAPIDCPVGREEIWRLTSKNRIKLPIIPPTLRNRGNYVVSLAKLSSWLGKLVEEKGVYLFPSFAGTEILYEGSRVAGVRAGDKGIAPDGSQKPTFEPGIDLKARLTVFAEGSRGSLVKALIRKFSLDEGRNPESYVNGMKEVWEVPDGRCMPGYVIHTIGNPFSTVCYTGGFVYGMKNNLVSLGLLNGLDCGNPYLDPHMEFQRFKTHPLIAEILKGGRLLQYGAKTVPVGGYFSIPRLVVDGGLIIGDSAGLFNTLKVKGIHLAMKSGMLAAETILDALLSDDVSAEALSSYERSLFAGSVGKELYRARNFHQAFQSGFWKGLIKAGLQYLLGGRIVKERLYSEPDFNQMKRVVDFYGTPTPDDEQTGVIGFDGSLTFDKESDLYYSGTVHEEQQPAHLKIPDLTICYTTCRETYHNPCTRFCPANVYVMEQDESTGELTMKLNFSNCLHCKTCDIRDPYENIQWVPPEGGGGPKYTVM